MISISLAHISSKYIFSIVSFWIILDQHIYVLFLGSYYVGDKFVQYTCNMTTHSKFNSSRACRTYTVITLNGIISQSWLILYPSIIFYYILVIGLNQGKQDIIWIFMPPSIMVWIALKWSELYLGACFYFYKPLASVPDIQWLTAKRPYCLHPFFTDITLSVLSLHG